MNPVAACAAGKHAGERRAARPGTRNALPFKPLKNIIISDWIKFAGQSGRPRVSVLWPTSGKTAGSGRQQAIAQIDGYLSTACRRVPGADPPAAGAADVLHQREAEAVPALRPTEETVEHVGQLGLGKAQRRRPPT